MRTAGAFEPEWIRLAIPNVHFGHRPTGGQEEEGKEDARDLVTGSPGRNDGGLERGAFLVSWSRCLSFSSAVAWSSESTL